MNGTDLNPRFVALPQGPRRSLIARRSVEPLRGAILDRPRSRPLYFDGRFLAASDLTREQEYFLDRQASLARALGAGVIAGLEVERLDADRLRITAGHGLTPAGELVALSEERSVDLSDVPGANRLNSAFGLRRRPQAPARNRSGLFVLALRPVEFTANPTASYPTSIDGRRSTQDGEVVEATAVTLVPYDAAAGAEPQSRRRARVAREIFVDGISPGLPAGVLPLAMAALERGQLVWLDPFLVRRELGRESGELLDLGLAPASLRRAAVLQYDRHLREVLQQRAESNRGQRFAASEHFFALPPVGPMPLGAVEAESFSQHYFPPAVETELTAVPEDELPALLEAGLQLPPIDLTLDRPELESTQVLMLAALPRREYHRLRAQIAAATPAEGAPGDDGPSTPPSGFDPSRILPLASPLPFRPAPRDLLSALRRPRLAPPRRSSELDAAWRQTLAAATSLFFVRRHNLRPEATLVGSPVELFEGGSEMSERLRERLQNFRQGRFDTLRENSTGPAVAQLESFLASDGLDSRLFVAGAIAELEVARSGANQPLGRAQVLAVQERYLLPDTLRGHAILREDHPEATDGQALALPLAEALRATQLARIAARAAQRVPELLERVAGAVEQIDDEDRLRETIQRLVDRTLAEIS